MAIIAAFLSLSGHFLVLVRFILNEECPKNWIEKSQTKYLSNTKCMDEQEQKITKIHSAFVVIQRKKHSTARYTHRTKELRELIESKESSAANLNFYIYHTFVTIATFTICHCSIQRHLKPITMALNLLAHSLSRSAVYFISANFFCVVPVVVVVVAVLASHYRPLLYVFLHLSFQLLIPRLLASYGCSPSPPPSFSSYWHFECVPFICYVVP